MTKDIELLVTELSAEVVMWINTCNYSKALYYSLQISGLLAGFPAPRSPLMPTLL